MFQARLGQLVVGGSLLQSLCWWQAGSNDENYWTVRIGIFSLAAFLRIRIRRGLEVVSERSQKS